MRLRHGVSLLECVVAILLLTIGMTGAAGASLVALRSLRYTASRDAAIRRATIQVDAFVTAPCLSRDSAWHHDGPDGVREQWAIARGDSTATLTGAVTVVSPSDAYRIPVRLDRLCL